MFVIHDRPNRLGDGLSRRELLRIGGLNLAGASLATLLHSPSVSGSPGTPSSPMFGRAKNIIYLWLQGGPPQHETFDPKPEAPLEIRGPFNPISTNVPGIHFSELLPRTAAMADKIAVVRSLATNDENHDVSGYWVLTGYKYPSGSARQIKPTDWPYFGSLVKMLRPSEELPAYSSVWLPDMMRLNDNVQPAGQTAGFLGKQWEPERFVCDPSAPDFRVESFTMPADLPSMRLQRRESLLSQVERHFTSLERSLDLANYDRLTQAAFDVLTSGRAREAFALERESAELRDRYGRSQWGQSVLLARRLVEAGVRLVHVNWAREPGDNAIDNPMWDTHSQNADRVKEVLCPQFDQTYTALLEDLDQRGLLDETLVVAIGEFGRTPKINKFGGRDHWGNVFSFSLAGAGISGGQVYGSSDRQGGYPASQRIEPQDLTATLFHLLGIDHHGSFPDRLGRPLSLTHGEPLFALLGTGPATTERAPYDFAARTISNYDPAMLIDGDFRRPADLASTSAYPPDRCWQASHLPDSQQPDALVVRRNTGESPLMELGWGFDSGRGAGVLLPDQPLILTQKLSSPRVGQYDCHIDLALQTSDLAAFEQAIRSHLRARLAIFSYLDLDKNPSRRREFTSVELTPQPGLSDAAPNFSRFTASTYLRSQDGGANQTSMGVGIGVFIENIGQTPLDLSACSVRWLIRNISLDFKARPRNELVME